MALDYHEMRSNALTRLKTRGGAAEILKHNFEEEQILNGNQIIGLNEQAALDQMRMEIEDEEPDQ